MLGHAGIEVVLLLLMQAAPAPPAPPVPPASAPPASVASKDIVALEPKALKPKMDSMQDVTPSTGLLARCAAGVVTAVPAFPSDSKWLTWRAATDHVDLVGKNASDKTAILATLKWHSTTLEWSWTRFSATSFAQALGDADRLLPWMTIQATLDDGTAVTVMAPPLKISRALTEAAPLVLHISAPSGQVLTFAVEPDTLWTAAPSVDGKGTQLACSQGSLSLTVDGATGRVEVRQDPAGGMTVATLRKQIADRTTELTHAIEAEKPFIEAELQVLRTRLAEAQAAARRERAAWPAIPQVRIIDQSGRVYAMLELQVR